MLPTLAAVGALALTAKILFNPARKSASQVTQVCQEKYCAPTYQILVDTPKNTLMRDDRPTQPTLQAAYELTKNTFYQEAHEHPGVRLVAHTLA